MSMRAGEPPSGRPNKVDGSNGSVSLTLYRRRKSQAWCLEASGDPANGCFGDIETPRELPPRPPAPLVEPCRELHVSYLRHPQGSVKVLFVYGDMDSVRAFAHAYDMPARKPGANAPNSIAFWRHFRGWTLEQLEERCGMTAATLSRLETGKVRYTQVSLEKIAAGLRVPPALLLIAPGPNGRMLYDALGSIMDATPEELRRFTALIQALKATG